MEMKLRCVEMIKNINSLVYLASIIDVVVLTKRFLIFQEVLAIDIDASLSVGPYVDIAAILEEAAQPRELIRVNGVNFIKPPCTKCLKLMPLIYTFIHVRIYSETDRNQKKRNVL